MDAVYNASHIGGGKLHRLFDGSHTFTGAWEKCQAALPDDSFTEEISGYLSAIGHDISSTVGLPLVNLSQETFHRLSEILKNFGISASWTSDILHINSVELLSAAVAVPALILHWNSNEVKRFGEIACGVAAGSLFAGNPIGLIMAISALAVYYERIKNKPQKVEELLHGGLKGIFKSGIFITLLTVAGNHIIIGIISALIIRSSVLTLAGHAKITP